MKRRIITILLSLGMLGSGLVAAIPSAASASTTGGVGIAWSPPDNCAFAQRHVLFPGTRLNAGDCYEGPLSFLIMQDDGNLVLYSKTSDWSWASNTEGNPGAFAIVQNDGNFVVYLGRFPKWASNTNGHDGARVILRGGDGSLLIKDPNGDVLWIRTPA
jgi:hypothetical protein